MASGHADLRNYYFSQRILTLPNSTHQRKNGSSLVWRLACRLDNVQPLLSRAAAGRLRVRTCCHSQAFAARTRCRACAPLARIIGRSGGTGICLEFTDYASGFLETAKRVCTDCPYSRHTIRDGRPAVLASISYRANFASVARKNSPKTDGLSAVRSIELGIVTGAHQLSISGRTSADAANASAIMVLGLRSLCSGMRLLRPAE